MELQLISLQQIEMQLKKRKQANVELKVKMMPIIECTKYDKHLNTFAVISCQ